MLWRLKMRKPITDIDWTKFGKDIWDAAANAYKSGASRVEVPLKMEDGGIARVIVTPPVYTQTRLGSKNGEPHTQWRHGVKLSDGSIKWSEWS